MHNQEEKYCPKCNNAFICRSENIAKCPCNAVNLSKSTVQFLKTTFYDCLCKNCLEKIDQSRKTLKFYQFPTQKEMFIEGLHYYIENDNWVFTELYHMLRGYCCQSGCRHCAYGFKKPS